METEYQKFYNEHGYEPNYADCLIRWKDSKETAEMKIALELNSESEMDDDVFFYVDSLSDLKSLTDEGVEDFVVVDFFGFGFHEKL